MPEPAECRTRVALYAPAFSVVGVTSSGGAALQKEGITAPRSRNSAGIAIFMASASIRCCVQVRFLSRITVTQEVGKDYFFWVINVTLVALVSDRLNHVSTRGLS